VAAEATPAVTPLASTETAPQAASVPVSPAPTSAADVVAAKPAPAPTPAPTPVAAARPGDWIVILGAHRNPGHAMDIARHTRAIGLPAFIEDATNGQQKRTKVRAGPFANKEQAEAALLKLSQRGIEGHVRQN
jgi:DedD protein